MALVYGGAKRCASGARSAGPIGASVHGPFNRERLKEGHGACPMIRLAAAALALLAASMPDDASLSPADSRADIALAELVFAQVVVQQQIIIRVPRGDARVPASSAPTRWRESNGPRCIQARQIAGAKPAASRVDLLMRDNRRIRARLARRCVALDYYRGLYVSANPDGQICAGRDQVRSRMGGACDIVDFRTLRPPAE